METFNVLIAENNRQIEARYIEQIERINTPEKLADYLRRANKTYKSDPEKHVIKLFRKQADKEKETTRQEIIAIEQAPDFSGDFIITVEWTKSRMWGNNPRASTNTGFEGSSNGGCGYDKSSTATAQALNSNKSILKLMYAKKNKNLNKSNHELLGYGSGYSLLPLFEGGVGISSHIRILEGVGLSMKTIADTKSVDVYSITKSSK